MGKNTSLMTSNEGDEYAELVAQLEPKQARFINMYLSGQYNKAQIAQLLGVEPSTVYTWGKMPAVKRIIEMEHEAIFDEMKDDLKLTSQKAMSTMRALLDSPIDGIRYQAAKDILDRNNLKGENKIKIDKTITTIEQRIGDLVNKTMGDIIDVELED